MSESKRMKTVELPVIPKEVAETIEHLRTYVYGDPTIIFKGPASQPCIREYIEESDENSQNYIRAVLDGYTVEKTPEDKIREFYARNSDEYASTLGTEFLLAGRRQGVKETLDSLGITIEGVND